MSWIFLIAAGIFEMLGVASISRYNQKKNIHTLLQLIGTFGASFFFLYLAMTVLPMGISYAIWTGIGAAGGAIIGMLRYGESKSWQRIFCIALILGAVIGLKLIS